MPEPIKRTLSELKALLGGATRLGFADDVKHWREEIRKAEAASN